MDNDRDQKYDGRNVHDRGDSVREGAHPLAQLQITKAKHGNGCNAQQDGCHGPTERQILELVAHFVGVLKHTGQIYPSAGRIAEQAVAYTAEYMTKKRQCQYDFHTIAPYCFLGNHGIQRFTLLQ